MIRRAVPGLATLLVAAVSLCGCDETRVRQGTSEFGALEASAMRVLVSPSGIGRLVEVANPDGFVLRRDSEELDVDGFDLTIGPIEQTIPVAARTATTDADQVTVITEFDSLTVLVGMRVGSNEGTRICRWRVQSSALEASATAALVDTEEGARFEVVGDPALDAEPWTVTPIEDCGLPDEEPTRPEDLRPALQEYVQQAIIGSAATSLETSPLDVLGLLRGNVQLSRLSLFENRRGTLAVEGAQSGRADGLELTDDGLSILLDAGVDAQRARCAPPISIDPPPTNGTDTLDPDVVRRFGADYALAISGRWVSDAAQGATLAGYACRGLEDARPPDRNEELVPVEEVMLGDLGLEAIPTGAWASLVMSPGTLPTVALHADRGTVTVHWEDLELDVYAHVFGANTRLARVITDVELGLRPRSGSLDAARFDIESVQVTPGRFESEFASRQPTDEALERWVRRTTLVLLDDAVTFPLPLMPTTPARVVGTQVRAGDIVLFVRFEPDTP